MKRFVPSLSTLLAFEAAAAYRNFTRAAEDLGLTQSGVSRHVGALERQLGIKLFERVGPRLVLTAAGKNYAKHVTRLLDGLEQATIDVVRGAPAKDALQIAVQDSLASQWLVPRMPNFLERFQPFDFNMTPVVALDDLAERGIDVAVLRGRGAWADAHVHHLFDEMVTVVAAPSLIPVGADLPLDAHQRFPLIQNAHRPDSWLRWLKAKGLARQDKITGPRFAQTTMVIEASIAGIGLGVVPTVMIEAHLASGALHTPFGPPEPSGFSYYVVYPLTLGASKRVLDFRDWLINQTRGLRQEASG